MRIDNHKTIPLINVGHKTYPSRNVDKEAGLITNYKDIFQREEVIALNKESDFAKYPFECRMGKIVGIFRVKRIH